MVVVEHVNKYSNKKEKNITIRTQSELISSYQKYERSSHLITTFTEIIKLVT
jgi:hypothetical protein